jgi:cytoskeletal protein CcmA (bactofilin family)
MALWKENVGVKPTSPAPISDLKEPARFDVVAAPAPEIAPIRDSYAQDTSTTSAPAKPPKESLIASDITIEGKIEGAGSVRIAGKFKGDVNVQGDLTIEAGAKLAGSVIANQVFIAGELEGNIEGAARVDLQQTGVITGDVKAGSLAVASGARMRGQAVFGWKDDNVPKASKNGSTEHGSGT